MQPNQRISPFFCSFLLFFFMIRASKHTRKAACVQGCCGAIGFLYNMIIPDYDWLVTYVKIMAIIFVYYFAQPFAVIGCVRRVNNL